MAFALFLLAVAVVLLYILKATGRVRDIGAYLRHLFFDPRDGLVLTRWLGDLFPELRR